MPFEKCRKKQAVLKEARNAQALPILSFGYSLPELKMKHKVLSEIGYKVTSLSDFSAVESLIVKAARNFTALIIGPRVRVQERQSLARLFRRHNSQGKVIVFYWNSIIDAENATAVLGERCSPKNLIDTIQALFGKIDLQLSNTSLGSPL
ncbi:MAG TPA: hypothetical protein VH596_03475 [Terriglobales bacterium]|jgi:hypothetical protein